MIEMDGLPELIKPTRAAEFCDVSVRTIRRAIDSGALGSVKVGRRSVRILRASLVEWLGGIEKPARRRRGREAYEAVCRRLGVDAGDDG